MILSEFPYVKVELDRKVSNHMKILNIIQIAGLRLYDNEQPFMIYFDATNVGFVNIKYAFKIVFFYKRT